MIMRALASLKAKLYGFEIDENDDIVECNRAKGVTKCVVKKQSHFKVMLIVYKKKKYQIVNNNFLRPRNKKFLISVKKKFALSPDYDKRYLIKNTTDTFARGHCKWRIINYENQLIKKNNLLSIVLRNKYYSKYMV